MQQYNTEDDQTHPKLNQSQQLVLSKHGEVKKSFDFVASTPGKTRKGVARHGDQLRGFTDYNMKLFRSDDKKWAFFLEWVDLDGAGHRIVLPHEVVAGLLQRANSIIAQCRSERSKNAALTRSKKRAAKAAEIIVDPSTETA